MMSLHFRTDLGALLLSLAERISEMRIIYETNHFRRYESVIAKDKSGNDIKMILCEDLDPESGRWEPYYAIRTIKQKRG